MWKAPADGSGTAVQVTSSGGTGPALSPDGRYVFFARGGDLWRIPVNGGEESRILEALSDWSRFAVTERGIYFMPRRSRPVETSVEHTVEFLSFSTGQIHTVARLAESPYLGMSVSPDGRWLLYSQVDQAGTDLMLVDDFR